jgi:Tfp pilus assembly protein PilX
MSFAMTRREAAARTAELSVLTATQFGASTTMYRAAAMAAQGPFRAVVRACAGANATAKTVNSITAS